MSDVTILHNPECSTCRSAVALTSEVGAEATLRNYLADPLTEAEWLGVLAVLDGEPGELVRKDENFTNLGLAEADVTGAQQVAKVLAEHPILAQRPVLIKAGRAIVGRPVSLIEPFLT